MVQLHATGTHFPSEGFDLNESILESTYTLGYQSGWVSHHPFLETN